MHHLSHWKKRVRKQYRKNSHASQWLLLLLLGAWVIYSDPFGIGSAGERASEQAIYRLTASSYESEKSEPNILVVLFNDKAIENLYPDIWQSNDWPLSYLDQVNLLTTIMGKAPSALFYDVMWMKQRSLDPSFDRAVAKLKAAQAVTNVPVYFAQGKADSSMSDKVVDALKPAVTFVPNGWEARGDLYPMYTQGVPTTAHALFRQYCSDNECAFPAREESHPISVRWSSIAAPVLLNHRKDECTDSDASFGGIILNGFVSILTNVIPGMGSDSAGQICPPQRVLYADELMALARSPVEAERAQLQQWIEESIVLVGGQIEGIHDYVISPVHGAMPGVFFHAMALDNLMVYQDQYVRENPSAKHINMMVWVIYISMLIAIRLLSSRYIRLNWLRKKLWLLSIVYVLLIIVIAFGFYHLAPASWVSILALGWLGAKLTERLDKLLGTQEREVTGNDG